MLLLLSTTFSVDSLHLFIYIFRATAKWAGYGETEKDVGFGEEGDEEAAGGREKARKDKFAEPMHIYIDEIVRQKTAYGRVEVKWPRCILALNKMEGP